MTACRGAVGNVARFGGSLSSTHLVTLGHVVSAINIVECETVMSRTAVPSLTSDTGGKNSSTEPDQTAIDDSAPPKLPPTACPPAPRQPTSILVARTAVPSLARRQRRRCPPSLPPTTLVYPHEFFSRRVGIEMDTVCVQRGHDSPFVVDCFGVVCFPSAHKRRD